MIHRFSQQGIYLVVDVNSGCVHIMDKLAYDILGELEGAQELQPQCPPQILETFAQFDPAQVREAYAELYELYREEKLFARDDYVDIARAIPQGAPVKALCLHVAHDCNLRCRYCFAGTGDFGQGRRIMPPEVGKKAIDFVIARSGKRRNIEVDFFGGEPLMAMETVKQTVAYAREQEERFDKKFRFTITTNGLLLDEENIAYINENMSNVVLSLDGRPEVNDAMRKTVNGGGSYATIVPKFQKLVRQRDPSRDYYVRGTFTAENLDFAEDVLHIADCGFDQLSVEPVSVQPGCGYELTEEHLPRIEAEYERLSQIMRQRKKEGRPFNFFHFMVDLEQGPCVIKRLRGCGAGYEYVAVTPEGDIYPCHQFVGQEQFRQGSVLDDTMDLDLAKTFSGLNIYTREQCRDCWAKFYCSGGCSAANYLMNGELKKPYELACRMERKRLECAIYLKAAEALERTEQDEQAVQS